ncbi:sporulation protein YunB [Sporosarcina sp. FA9]|uniref:sporulation protein YunB n=1 Tax=Sporosarcina sp. FA9 TaxID=3413030 RepID=UPI003F65BFBB
MKFHGQVNRRPRRKVKKRKMIPLLFLAILFAIVFSLYFVNMKLTPIYTEFAEVQTQKIASQVISSAINARVANVLDVNDIIVNIPPSESGGIVGTKFNTEIINRVIAEIQILVQQQLDQAESGNLDLLPSSGEIDYDPQAMEDRGGIVFLIPMGQAIGLPLLGNLGPKIPIRFHVIGEVQANPETSIKEFGINNASIEVNVLLEVNVQIIVPLATKNSVVRQKIPIAAGLFKGDVPPIYNKGSGDAITPQIEIPFKLPEDKE